MKRTSETKQSVIIYLLEKINEKTKSLSKVVSEVFGISANTVHTYINELIEQGIIKKTKRDEYELVTHQTVHTFRRREGELESDTVAYEVCLAERVKHLPENVGHIWSYALSEMVNNVIDHSQAETMQVIVAQNYFKTYVTVLDDGVGIFEKIKNHFSFPSLDAAICELFKGKLTTDETNHSGEGIFFTSRMMDSFLISSGGKIFTTSKYNNDVILNVEEPPTGTCVFMALSNFTQRSAREVFDLYSDTDGAFNSTRIPLKHIFDGAPVSRSQAKRVCNRLETFEEVVLDFDGISWMGQGFAHQLFVVYKNAHPQVSLVPINMNESVTNMYHHVIRTV